jgi:hypothetical protein
MRLVQAGKEQLIALEPDRDVIRNVVRQAGFDCSIQEDQRHLILEVKATSPKAPLLLFDAAEPANLGWFSRCQFYVDGFSGAVLQTPLALANCFDNEGRPLPKLRIALLKELPADFRLPGRQSVNEQVVYALLFNLLAALKESGVGICGKGVVEPLAGRTKAPSR